MRGRRRATPRGRDEMYAQSKGSGEAGRVKRDGRGGADAGGGAGAADAEYKLGASHPSKSFDHLSYVSTFMPKFVHRMVLVQVHSASAES
jgi:hypothetical protein